MKRLLIIVAGLALVVFLFWHWKLGMVRYFDVDEFAYLHWARQISLGQKPYIDFFFYIPPGFVWFLAPLFWLGSGIWPVLAARAVAFGVFAALCGVLGYLFFLLRGEKKEYWRAILPGAILAFLPLPFDKFLEIRPDTLAMLLVIVGMILQTLAAARDRVRPCQWAGVVYGLSMLVLPKSAPFVLVAVIVELFLSRKRAAHLVAGAVVPLGLFAVWLLTLGDVDAIWYSLTRLPFETSKIAQTFVMQPDLFFYPNPVFYGTAGVSRELLVNHIFWIVGLGMGVYRVLTSWRKPLVPAMYLVAIASFVYLYPLRHAQYLIPVAVFVAFYASDLIVVAWEKARGAVVTQWMFAAGLVIFFVFLWDTFMATNRPKLAWDNRQMLADMKAMWEIIPKGAHVLDLDGRTLYFKDPYYVCCLPFGQYEQYLTRPLPSLEKALEQTNTQYIYEGQLERVKTLSAESQKYIRNNFQKTEVTGLLRRK